MKTYRVEYTNEIGGVAEYDMGAARKSAISRARRVSKRLASMAYVVVADGERDIGQISYYCGYRDNVDGVTA